MFDLTLAAGDSIFALRSAYSSPEGSCPLFQPGPPSFCMLLLVEKDEENPGAACDGINYHNGIICLRISHYLNEESYIP